MRSNVIEINWNRNEEGKHRKRNPINLRKKGTVFTRNGKLWVDFYYLKKRVRERTGLTDSVSNRVVIRKKLDLIEAEVENGVFEFAEAFPYSSRKEYFSALEGRVIKKDPKNITFGEYAKKWFEINGPRMSFSKRRDYRIILKTHLLPDLGEMPFSDLCTKYQLEEYISVLQEKKTRLDQPLSGKRIQNVMIPLRVITSKAIDQYGWLELKKPFSEVKLPEITEFRIQPFNLQDWKRLMQFMLPWYVPYFEIAVQTGLRPSEQVALKWQAIDDEYIHVELSRVYNREKTQLKTRKSKRSIKISEGIRNSLEKQKKMTEHLNSPYVFLNTQGRPILQDKLREVWARVIKKAGISHRRMYETRHTFASWALQAGESPEWVAKTLGHTNVAMLFEVYSRYIPNLTRRDGSAFERQYREGFDEKQPK